MKKMMTWVGVTMLVLGLALILVTPASTRTTANTPTTAAAAAPAPVPDHPEIRKALDSLKSARAHIHEARHDFNGHREEALIKIDEAIRQLEICMQYDR
ncbi:MAG TPA: hypothetical protein VLV89_10695 [Candidatus Acidoferrum sp.]|nr:hypothetical protein [Candidatus Acidoferrum sp.]